MEFFKTPEEEDRGHEPEGAAPPPEGAFPEASPALRGRTWLRKWLRLNWARLIVPVVIIGFLVVSAIVLVIQAAHMRVSPVQGHVLPVTASPEMHGSPYDTGGIALGNAYRVPTAANTVGPPPGVDPLEWQRYMEWRARCPNGQCPTDGQANGQQSEAAQRAQRAREAMEKARAAKPDAGNQHQTAAATAPAAAPPATPAAPEAAPAAPVPQQQGKQVDAPWDNSTGQQYILLAGVSLIKARLINGITGEAKGPVIAEVVHPTYSWDLSKVLIPKGTYLTGHYDRVEGQDQERVLLAIDSMTFPDGYRVSFPETEIMDQAGQVGIRDLVNHHYTQMFLTSVALSGIGASAQFGGGSGYSFSPVDVLRIGLGQGASQFASQAFNRFAFRKPTLTIRPGKEIIIFSPIDVTLPAWNAHAVRSPL